VHGRDRPTRRHEGTGRDAKHRWLSPCGRFTLFVSRLNGLLYGSFGSGGVLFGNMRSLLACSKA
jgi:uncharacterized membrane protein YfcA